MPLKRTDPNASKPAASVGTATTEGPVSSSPEKPAGLLLGINLFDLTRIPAIIRECLRLGDKISHDRSRVVKVDPDRIDETVVPFVCPLLEAALVCDVIRGQDRQGGDYPTRVYLFRRTWSKLTATAVLTLVRDGVPMLNPEWFPHDIELAPVKPLRRRAVQLGGQE